MRRWPARALLGTLSGLAVLLVGSGPRPGRMAAAVGGGDLDAALSAVCSLLATGLLAAVATATVLEYARRAPGRLGAAAAALQRRCVPAALRGLTAAAIGAPVALASPAALAAPVVPHPQPAPSGRLALAVPDLDRGPTPRLTGPTARSGHAASHRRPVPRAGDRATDVVVRPGDCLWRVAARTLGPGATDAQVARAWPRWWQANRLVIGADPALVHPGQHLRTPPSVPSEPTRSQP